MTKYDSLRKLARNKQLRRYRKEHPGLSWREIGEAFGITESRAWRIYHKNTK